MASDNRLQDLLLPRFQIGVLHLVLNVYRGYHTFVVSRGFTRQAIMVLIFTASFAAAGFYDTFLWALDSPGFVIKSAMVDASSVTRELLANPAYIVFLSDASVSTINIEEAIGANLYKSGFNFTLPGLVSAGAREVVSTNQSLKDAGPRIWLDDDGFSVGVDQSVMITTDYLCPTRTLDENHQMWLCSVNNTEAQALLQWPTGMPDIWWDNVQSEFLTPNHRDNPWQSLGTGGDTAVMKQIFTVTKGKRRHTFMETAFKVSMLTLFPTPFDNAEIVDILRRTWSNNASQPITPQLQASIDIVISAQANQTSLTRGWFFQEKYSVLASSIELLNVLNAATSDRVCSVLRITSTNITLIRSETLPEPVVPFASCHLFFTNLATGGRVRSSTCAKSIGNQTGARFLGQLDSSSMLILTGSIGDGTTSTSAAALNQTGLDWFTHNEDRLDQFITSRGFILGGNAATVQVEVKHNEAAISYLQLILVIIPALLAFAAWILTTREPTGYYGSSFLAAVCATTHIAGESTYQQVGYVRVPPELRLRSKGQHVFIETPSGVLVNVEADQTVPYSPNTEPLLDEDAVMTQDSVYGITLMGEVGQRGGV